MRTCVELGHALGNQHWPALVKGTRVFVPLTVDRKVMASVMNTHRFEGIRYEFVPGDDIVPYLAPHESRRLFGGAEGPVHTHTARSLCRSRSGNGTRARALAGACARPSARRRRSGRMNPRDDGAASPVTAAHLARLLQFGDSMFPIGGFAFSGGLESAIQKRVVTDARHAARVRAHRGRAGGSRRRHRARLRAPRRRGGRRRRARAHRRAGLRTQALGRDADDVRAHGQEVHGDGRRR